MIGLRITPGIATIIGAAAAIAGGLGAAYYQSRQTRRLAIQLRAQEREEAGLLRLGAMLAEIRSPMETYLWLDKQGHVRENPQPAAEAEQFRSRLIEPVARGPGVAHSRRGDRSWCCRPFEQARRSRERWKSDAD